MLGQDHYIHRLRAACILQPHLNRHQLAALDRELVLARRAASPEAHLEASGHLLGLARAAEMDRAANSLDIARRYDDPWSAAAAGIEYIHAQQGANHVELFTSIQIGHERAAPLRALSAQIRTDFTRLFINLLHVQTSNFELGPVYEQIVYSFQTLRNSDPAFVPRTWIDHPRYHRRLPWHSELIHQWLEPYWEIDALNPPDIPADPGFLIQPGEWGAEAWPAATPLDAPADTTNAGIYLARQDEWPDEFLASHWQATRAAMQEAGSHIAQYAVATDREALFAIESTRHYLHLSMLLAPLRAVANHGWQQAEESRSGLDKALATSRALTGMDLEQILASPRIQHFLEHNLRPRLEYGGEGFGALNGEAGFDLLRHAYPWQCVRGSVDFYA